MTRNTLILKPIIAIILLGILVSGQTIKAESPSESETVENRESAGTKNSKELADGQITVQFSQNEIDAISATLPDGEARQMFKEKVTKGEEKDDATFDDDSIRSRIFIRGRVTFSPAFFRSLDSIFHCRVKVG